MGNNQSSQQQQQKPKPSSGGKQKPAPVQQQVVQKPVDCVIIGAPSDSGLCGFLTKKLEAASISSFSNLSDSDEASKQVGKALVDTKLLIFIVSDDSGSSSRCGNQLSLAYISNKPILLAAKKARDELIGKCRTGLKLTLQQLTWTVLEGDDPNDDVVKEFMGRVHKTLEKPVQEQAEAVVEPVLESTNRPYAQRLRLNTRLQRSVTEGEEGEAVEAEATDTFWDRNFSGESDAPWYEFERAFLSDYENDLKEMFTENLEENTSWLLDMLHNDVFGGAGKISKDHFMQVRGDSKTQGFWMIVKQIAVEKFNMKEVFDMQSTVRLTAVENLGKFQNPAVIEALLRLLEDDDPNIRAVAAISLGRTKVDNEIVIDRLILLLKDSDRIVRQSGCLSLGALKAKKAISHIGDRWRNDFISVVRDAARTALERMDVPEAQEVLKVTRVLEDEIKQLQGGIVAV